jgi:hypothetical protein
VAIALPVATAIAGNGNGRGQVKSFTAKHCNAERRADSGAFQAMFADPQSGKHAMRNCMRETRSEVNGDFKNAVQFCRNEIVKLGLDVFIDTYGSNEAPNPQARDHGQGFLRNAFGKCVSGEVSQAIDDDVDDFETAAQQCRAERAADPDTFLGTWGGNNVSEGQNNAPDGEKSKGAERKAFGKCVSATARQLEQEAVEEPTTEEEPPPAV